MESCRRNGENVHWLNDFIRLHPLLAGALGMWFFSNLVSTMPTPRPNSNQFYEWAFGLLHAIGAGLPRIIATFAPQYAKFVGAGAVLEQKAIAPPTN